MNSDSSLTTLTDSRMHDAQVHLRFADKRLSLLISKFGSCPIREKYNGYFDTLASSIISQQISSIAASSIKTRIELALGRRRPFRPIDLRYANDSLRAAGLSRRKVLYLTELAEAFSHHKISIRKLKLLSNAEVKSNLMQFRGIGEWTAEMFMIFSLGRADIFSSTDSGLRRATALLYQRRGILSPQEFSKIARKWIPYRSVASWYLWRSLD